MTDDPTGSSATGRWARSARRFLPTLGVLALAAVIGGVVGGVIVKETWTSGSGNGGNGAASGGTSAACRASRVADEALPSVVTVRASNGQQGGSGSGVVVRSGGYILTNNHVVAVAAVASGRISIVRSDGEATDARIVGRDPLTDLAVIRADNTSGLPPIRLGDSGSVQVGEPVVALGSPLGLASTVTAGIISALNRYVQVPSENGQAALLVGAIQTDASINPGNSGGALLDCSARLIGINTAGAAIPNSAGGSIGLGFAIPVDLAKGIAEELIANGRVTRPSFGMQVQEIPVEVAHATGAPQGLYVTTVTSGGAAERAGLRPGDIIVEIDGEPARSADALTLRTLTMSAGDTIRVTYERQGSTHTTTLTLTAGD